VISSLEAAEAIKFLSGRRESMSRDLVAVDVWEGRIERIRLRRRSGPADGRGGRRGMAGGEDVCPVCVQGSFDHLEGACASRASVMCGRDSLQVVPASRTELDLEGLARRLAAIGEVTANRFLVRVRVGRNELAVFRDGRAIVSGTTDPGEARALYARYIGI
jgi:adenylyltransferase/sulfurtransferase